MKKRFYTKKCASCKLIFRTENKGATVCSACEKKGKTAPPKKKTRIPRPTYGISTPEFCCALGRYNARMHTRYTYGQAVMLVDSGYISRKEFLKP